MENGKSQMVGEVVNPQTSQNNGLSGSAGENTPIDRKGEFSARPHLSGTHPIDDIVRRAKEAAEKASRKFPQPNYVTLKIAEEAGEVVRGCVHYAEGRMPWDEVENEIVQLIAMLIRLVTEGDEVNGVHPPAVLKGERTGQ